MNAGTTCELDPLLARYDRRLGFVGSLVLAGVVLLIVGIMLVEARNDAWAQAQTSSQNLKQAIIGDIQTQMNRYAQALEFTAREFSGLKVRDGLASEKQHFLERMARDTGISGGVLVLDKDGYAVAQSGGDMPSDTSFADKAYFRVQRDADDVGIYVSEPFETRLHNDLSVALSRRISTATGEFAGVVVIAMRLGSFSDVLKRVNVGTDSVLAILNDKGRILSRQPSADSNGDAGRDVSENPAFRAFGRGTNPVAAFSEDDEVERLYSFGSVPGYPLIVSVALATEGIMAGWWRLVLVIGPATLLVCIAIVTLAAALQHKIDYLARTDARLALLATTDGLTGLANRRHFDAAIESEWNRARRDGSCLSLVLIDADRFKLVNDRFGHIKGDDVLKSIARCIEKKARRAGDLTARFGGEEFVVLLPATRGTAALAMAEAIRAEIATSSEEAAAAGRPGTTISLGVATMTPDRSNSIQQLLNAADQALYQAKAEGRNRAVLAGTAITAG